MRQQIVVGGMDTWSPSPCPVSSVNIGMKRYEVQGEGSNVVQYAENYNEHSLHCCVSLPS